MKKVIGALTSESTKAHQKNKANIFFITGSFVLVEAAMNHSGVPGSCLALLLTIKYSLYIKRVQT